MFGIGISNKEKSLYSKTELERMIASSISPVQTLKWLVELEKLKS